MPSHLSLIKMEDKYTLKTLPRGFSGMLDIIRIVWLWVSCTQWLTCSDVVLKYKSTSTKVPSCTTVILVEPTTIKWHTHNPHTTKTQDKINHAYTKILPRYGLFISITAHIHIHTLLSCWSHVHHERLAQGNPWNTRLPQI